MRSGSWRSASASVPASRSSAVACSPSPTGAAGCSTGRDGWRRWRWRCWRSSSPRRSAATRSCRRSSAGWSSARRPAADAAESVELAELGGSLLSLVLWFVFGAGFVHPGVRGPRRPRRASTPSCSLTVVRMVPVAIALARRRAGPGHDGVHRLVRPTRSGVGGVRPARGRGPRAAATHASSPPSTPSPSPSCSASSPTGSRRGRSPPATSPRSGRRRSPGHGRRIAHLQARTRRRLIWSPTVSISGTTATRSAV